MVPSDTNYYIKPKKVNKTEPLAVLKYAMGATLYLNGKMPLFEKITSSCQTYRSLIICFEDAITEADLPECEANTLACLTQLAELSEVERQQLPLLFIRVRHLKQYRAFTDRMSSQQLSQLTGFVFPKFDSDEGLFYFATLKLLQGKATAPLYGLPILEGRRLIYRETRHDELVKLKRIFECYQADILNIRVGGTDFSGLYGFRRQPTTTIYDLHVVRDALTDIMNMFGRAEDGFIISGPVWEYFSTQPHAPEVQTFKREIELDVENGFLGKTVIHPLQVPIVEVGYAISYERYQDAKTIMENAQVAVGGVSKGFGGNKMNETKPHMEWAKKTLTCATIYGVLHPQNEDNVN